MDPALLRAAYDRFADRYDETLSAQQQEKYRVLAHLVPAPAPGERVLDAGGGTGLLGPALAALDGRWAEARLVVADLSHSMLLHASWRGETCVQADNRRLPFRRAAFARVLVVTGVIGAENVEPALVSAARVLAPGGWLGLTLRRFDLPETLDDLLARLPLARRAEAEAAGDAVFAFQRT